MKGCVEAVKVAAAKCDDTALVKVKEACPKNEGSPQPTCNTIKKISEELVKKKH